MAQSDGRPEEAVVCLLRAIENAPNTGEYHFALGLNYRRTRRAEDAIASFRRVTALNPAAVGAHVNLGEALASLGRFDEAIQSYERALALQPACAEALLNLGHVLMQIGRLDEAIDSSRRAIAANPKLPAAHLNLGAALLRNRMFLPAIDAFRKAIALRPDYFEAHKTLSLVLLLLGRNEEGWKEYEWRWQYPAWSQRWNSLVAPRWDGTPLPGGTVWLHFEQGYGDAIQFLRYVPIAGQRSAAPVVLVCPPKLGRLLGAAGNCAASVLVREGLDGVHWPATDRHLPMLSLPSTLGVYEPLPMHTPYLRADPDLRATWQKRLGAATGLRVGLAWFGNPDNEENPTRSLKAAQLAPLLEIPGITFINLQIDARGGKPALPHGADRWVDATAQITDFADTAAILAEIDLIITTDTAIAHLAGALGRPVWTLLRCVPDWRWGLEGEDCAWYPTMRLFRQPKPGDWESALRRVAEELRALRLSPSS
jgi:Flp pilus assembly protein TadD